ncbi:MAG: hypothetical protein ABIQ35_02820, partial [Verrucomicrobiota bacterium]
TQAEPLLEIVRRGSMHLNPLVIAQDWRGSGALVSDHERAALLQRTTAYKRNPLLAPARFIYRVVEKGLGQLDLADNIFIVLRKIAENK